MEDKNLYILVVTTVLARQQHQVIRNLQKYKIIFAYMQ